MASEVDRLQQLKDETEQRRRRYQDRERLLKEQADGEVEHGEVFMCRAN